MPWWVLLALIAITAGAVAFGVRWLRHRRSLESVARKHKMTRPNPAALQELLSSLPEDWVRAGFREPLMGRDGSGRYLAARRGRAHRSEEIFLVELSRHTPARGLALHSREGRRGDEIQMCWNMTPDQALDNQSREIAQRVLREFAAFRMQHLGLMVSLEVGERGAVIHTLSLGDGARDDFIAAARVLRRDLMHCLYRRSQGGERTQAVQPVSIEDAPSLSEGSQDPAPRGVEAVDGEVERALENIEAQPLVSVKELVTEKPAPAKRKGWRRVGYKEFFEVPEPDDQVEVLHAQASSTGRKKLMEDEPEPTKATDFF